VKAAPEDRKRPVYRLEDHVEEHCHRNVSREHDEEGHETEPPQWLGCKDVGGSRCGIAADEHRRAR
jgi:hypothetical protein